MANVPGENKLPANKCVGAVKLPGEVYLPGEVIPGTRSRGSSICRENCSPGSLSAPLSGFSRQITCHFIGVVV